MNTRITGIWPLGLAIGVALIALLLLSWASMVERMNFLGIAESREIAINSENPVEIEKVHVLEGQSVERGQLLIQLRDPELTLKINQISHQLEQYRAKKDVDKSELNSLLTRLIAEKQALIDETNYRILSLKNDYNLNKSLAYGLQSLSSKSLTDTEPEADHPTLQKIERLKLELASAVQVYDVRIELQKKAITAADKPLSIQINQLEKELLMLKAESGKLSKYAPISGMIGSINFKAGEKVPPFAAVMTIHSKAPSIVKGYLHEDEFSKVQVNDVLTIHSTANSRNRIEGTIVGVGSRIIEYPVRLRRHQDVIAWGREISIKIPDTNNLILGEKVLVSLNAKSRPFWRRIKEYILPSETIAAVVHKNGYERPVLPMENVSAVRPISSLSEQGLEASAMVYLPNEGQFLVASDETPDQRLILYLMDLSGQITRGITIEGIDQIDDIESLTRNADNGTIYLASSLSPQKNNAFPIGRRLLVSIKQNKDKSFYLYRSIDLFNLLISSAIENKNEPWAAFINNAVENGDLNMEAMFWHDKSLYLGFKSPLFMNRSIILKISKADSIFELEKINGRQVAIWQMLVLKSDENDIHERISDLLFVDGKLFITGVAETRLRKKHSGSLWRLDIENGGLERITTFQDIKPEGIALTDEPADLMICFDQGRNHQSQIARIKGVR